MTVLLAVCSSFVDSEAVSSCLGQAGLTLAKPSRQQQLTPGALQELLARQKGVFSEIGATPTPSRLASELASDLLIANLDAPFWGWVDSGNLALLPFWRLMSDEVKQFVVYQSPLRYLQCALATVDGSVDPQYVRTVLDRWLHEHEQLLSVAHQFGVDTVLIEAGWLQQHTDTAVNLLASRFTPATSSSDELNEANPTQVGQQDGTPLPVLDISVAGDPLFNALLRMLPDNSPCWPLFFELESVADLPSSWVPEWGVGDALAEWQALRSGSAAQQQLQTSHNIVKSQSSCLFSMRSALQRAEVVKELLSRDLVRSHVRAEQEAIFVQKQAATLTSELAAERAKLTQAKAALDKLQKDKQAAEAKASQELTQAKAALKDQTEEGELLLMQLHQVQEELERYFLKLQSYKAETQEQIKPLQLVSDLWQHHKVNDIWIDMRQPLLCNNWHNIEHDGRWAGPGTVSDITLPAMKPGKYHIDLHVVDAIQPDLLTQMALHVVTEHGEIPVSLLHNFPLTGALFPMVTQGQFELPEHSQPIDLRLTFTQTVSPSTLGIPDDRELAIRLQGIQLKAL